MSARPAVTPLRSGSATAVLEHGQVPDQAATPGPERTAPSAAPLVARRVLLVDDQQIFTEALAALLDDQDDLQVVGQARTAGEALAVVNVWRPDIVVLSATTAVDDRLELVSRLLDQQPGLLVAVLAESESVDLVVDALRRGASAWVPKYEQAELLLSVLRSLRPGECYLPPRLLGRAIQALAQALRPIPEQGPLTALTPREREVLQCMVDGSDRAVIASRLCLSPNTIRTHTQNVLGKLGVHSVVEAVALGMQHGLRPSALDQA